MPVPRFHHPHPVADDTWRADALCAQIGDWHPFFPADGCDPTPARRVCAHCPVRRPCLQDALDNHETGVWGGTTEHERRLIRREAS